jgi:hypothetical protein
MIRRLSTSMLVALVSGALLAGCGSSSSSSTTSGTTSGSTSSAPATSSTSTSGPSSIPAVASAVAACKRGVQAAPTLSSTTKSKLEGICDKAANGDQEAARKAAKEVCTEIVNSSPLPAGSAKDQALAACKAEASK